MSISEDPSYKFENDILKKKIQELVALFENMNNICAGETFPTKNKKQSIRRRKYGDSTDDFETGEELNKISRKLFNVYGEFIEKARKELHV